MNTNITNPTTNSINLKFKFDLSNKKSLTILFDNPNIPPLEFKAFLPPPLDSTFDFSKTDPSKIDDYDKLSSFAKMFLKNISDFQDIGEIKTYYNWRVKMVVAKLFDQIAKENSNFNKDTKINLIFESDKESYIQIENLIRPIVSNFYSLYNRIQPSKKFTDDFKFIYKNDKSKQEIDMATILYYLSPCKSFQEFSLQEEKLLARLLSKYSKKDLEKMTKLHHQMFHEGQEMADIHSKKKTHN